MSEVKTGAERETAAHDTVEAAVRAQLSKALGGVRGMVEAAVPTIAFTGTYVAIEDIKLAVTAASAPRWCCSPSGSHSAPAPSSS